MTDIDPFEALPDDRRPLSEPPQPARGGRRIVVGAVLAIAIFGGFGAIAWVAYNRGFYSASDELAPLVRADDGPTRRRPADPGGLDIPDQDKLVFERLSPGQAQTGVERLLPEPEEPLPLPDPAPAPSAADSPEQSLTATVQPLPEPPGQPSAGAPAVDGELDLEAVIAAVSEDLPVPPAPPEIPAEVAVDEPPAPPEPEAVAEAPPEAPTPEAVEQPIVAAAPPPEPEPAPTEVESLPLPESEESAAVVPANGADPAPEPAPASAGDGWRIQLAAVRDEGGAAAEWKRLQGKHPQLLGALALSIQRADLDAGTFFRIQAGPLSDQAAARQRCADLATAGQDCLVVRP